MYDETFLESLTRFGDHDRDSLIRYYLNLPESLRIEAHRLQEAFKCNYSGGVSEKFAEVSYAMLLRAIHRIRSEERNDASKLDDPKRQDLIRREFARFNKQRKSPSRNLICIRLFTLIEDLRNKGISWRGIQKYIALYHKRNIAHSYIKRCWEEEMAVRKREGAVRLNVD